MIESHASATRFLKLGAILPKKSRPLLPSGKVSALGPDGSRFKTRFHRRSVVYGACCTLNHTLWPNVLLLVWRGSLEAGANSGVVHVI
ncbi:hypothetical protein AVEN_256435-1 [Araneus ventricosus]|uniref:Uncharacterized protein n=1 Tax=Araneus ventricosus TaxID=182803 RepID=A0A4Y2QD50_ARAVE|nr:hypothetical protein AVEN_256435-1 [Araneus ventricosus]